MAIIRRTRRHSGQFFQRRATDAFRYLGEECLVVGIADTFDHPKRVFESEAYDDVYNELSTTEFTKDIIEKLVTDVYRCWAIISSPTRGDKASETGHNDPIELDCQVEPHVPLRTGDFLIRYSEWSMRGPIGDGERFRVSGDVDPSSIRDGAHSSGRLPQLGQTLRIRKIPLSDPFYRWSPGDETVRYREGALNDYYGEGAYGLENYGGF